MAAEKNIAAFLDKTAYTVTVVYQFSNSTGQGSKRLSAIDDADDGPAGYDYITNIPGIQPGDFVVVPTTPERGYQDVKRIAVPTELQELISATDADSAVIDMAGQTYEFADRLSVARVLRVHKDVTAEPNSDIKYKWVISRVDLLHYAKTMLRNAKLEATIQEAYKKSMRRSFADRILAELGADEQGEIKKLLGN